MSDFGFKVLDIDNWREQDETTRQFRRISSDGQPQLLTGNDWMRRILKPQLLDEVPIEVRKLFEVARGTLAYGYFFYPLYTLAAEQLFRVAETAIKHKCRQCKAPKSARSFFKRLKWLQENGIISETEHRTWTGVRKLRNSASHPDDQTILPPGMGITVLSRAAEMINGLFEDT